MLRGIYILASNTPANFIITGIPIVSKGMPSSERCHRETTSTTSRRGCAKRIRSATTSFPKYGRKVPKKYSISFEGPSYSLAITCRAPSSHCGVAMTQTVQTPIDREHRLKTALVGVGVAYCIYAGQTTYTSRFHEKK